MPEYQKVPCLVETCEHVEADVDVRVAKRRIVVHLLEAHDLTLHNLKADFAAAETHQKRARK